MDEILRVAGQSFLFGGQSIYVSGIVTTTSRYYDNIAVIFCGLDQTSNLNCDITSFVDVDLISNSSIYSLTQRMCNDGKKTLLQIKCFFLPEPS